MSYLVAIIGRPNVGKSTLFNRLTGSKQSIISDVSGVTRDRIYGDGEWNGKTFSLIDTGGFTDDVVDKDEFSPQVISQIQLAIEECHAFIFLVDVKSGITKTDQTLFRNIRDSKKKQYVVVNKVDNALVESEKYEFYKLGVDEVFSVSAINGSGTGELLDEIVKDVPAPDEPDMRENTIPKIAIVGRPNAGKSSLVNTLIGEERVVVSEISGTTRDSTETQVHKFNMDFILVDTAGIRKKSKVHEDIEFFSVLRAIRTIEKADVCILLIDAEVGLQAQDMKILSLMVKNKKGIVLALNKWDLLQDKHELAQKMKQEVTEKIRPLHRVPIFFISATEKQRVLKMLKSALEVAEKRKKKISTKQLNDFLLPVLKHSPHPIIKRKTVKFKHLLQLKNVAFPAFVFFCTHPELVKDPYKRFIQNQLQKEFDFEGNTISLSFRKHQ